MYASLYKRIILIYDDARTLSNELTTCLDMYQLHGPLWSLLWLYSVSFFKHDVPESRFCNFSEIAL